MHKKLKTLIFSLGLGLLSTFVSQTVTYAAEKDVTVKIDKKYNSAKFTISFEKEGKYKATVISPKDEKTETVESKDKEGELVAVVQDVPTGEWKVHIESGSGEGLSLEELLNGAESSEDIPSSDDQDAEDTGEENSTASDEIGKVKVKVEGSYEELVGVEGDISVAEDITGLSMHFKDDDLVVTWTDKNIGNVDVVVSDSKTMQELARESVADRQFTLNIDEKMHPQILVTVVPSVSSGIEGAQHTYTLNVANHPNATVSFDDIAITNKDSIGAVAELNQPYKLQTVVNGVIVSTTDVLGVGSHDVTIPIENEENDIQLYLIDPDTKNMRSFSKHVTQDVIGPVFSVAKEMSGLVVNEKTIVFEGDIESGYDTFTINDADIKVEGDHTWKYEYELKEGINNISLVATDPAGNVSKYDATVTYEVPEEKPSIFVRLLPLFIIFAIGAVIYKKYELKKKKEQEELRKKKRRKGTKKKGSGSVREKLSEEEDDRILEGAHKTSIFEQIIMKINAAGKDREAVYVDDVPRKEFTIKDMDRYLARADSSKSPFILARILGKFGIGGDVAYTINDVVGAMVPFFVSLIFFICLVQATTCASASMEPTLMTGNTVFYNRLAYVNNDVQRGDIVNFWSDENGVYMAKRVIGIGGDEIRFKDGYVVINGLIADESDYLDPEIETNMYDTEAVFNVPEGYIFVMGDNREVSADSRFFDNPYIPVKAVKGKYMGQLPVSVVEDIIKPIKRLLSHKDTVTSDVDRDILSTLIEK